jgi:hypothetical protein
LDILETGKDTYKLFGAALTRLKDLKTANLRFLVSLGGIGMVFREWKSEKLEKFGVELDIREEEESVELGGFIGSLGECL